MSILLKIILTIVAGIGVPFLLCIVFATIINTCVKSEIASVFHLLSLLGVIIGGTVLWALFFGWFAVLYCILTIPVALIVFGICASM